MVIQKSSLFLNIIKTKKNLCHVRIERRSNKIFSFSQLSAGSDSTKYIHKPVSRDHIYFHNSKFNSKISSAVQFVIRRVEYIEALICTYSFKVY